MRKKISILLMIIILLTSIQNLVIASERTIPDERLLPRLVDNAYLLTDEEATTLLEKLDRISEEQGLDVVIFTVNSLEGSTPTEFADDTFDYNGYGMGENFDGILLLLSMEERDWAISTTGYGITVFTDAGQNYIMDEVLPYLGDGEYYRGFDRFADLSEEFIIEAKTNKPIDSVDIPNRPIESVYVPKKKMGFELVFISLGSGIVIAFIVTGIMKRQLKSVRYQVAASNYILSNSLKVGNSRDLFLYNTISKRARPKQQPPSSSGSSTHRSSSGRSHGGSSGKF